MVSLTKSTALLPPQNENTIHRSLHKNVFYFFFYKIHEYNSEPPPRAHIKNSTVYERTLQKQQWRVFELTLEE